CTRAMYSSGWFGYYW
nr:immunoglobulin heavy chain junction region [Macaca mulatta]MPN83942.1 immunoglobulin heavy chain junction region [Macaca mulatta]MPN83956.1 immunoglobulin heavy chain junction region [Macaca mulatta]MPN83977.1 immunoglobulin heavy chain junction region [Macaca mulatta]MPN84005.1 immunoglobulin heavy chain junction region [Macaca mulatta]